MAAISRIGDKLSDNSSLALTDFEPILIWLDSVTASIRAEFSAIYIPAREAIRLKSDPLTPFLSTKGSSTFSWLQDLLAMVIAAFTYVKQKLCS